MRQESTWKGEKNKLRHQWSERFILSIPICPLIESKARQRLPACNASQTCSSNIPDYKCSITKVPHRIILWGENIRVEAIFYINAKYPS